MAGPPVTQAERLTRIETLLETAVVQRTEDLTQRDKDREAMRKTIDKMAENIEQIKDEITSLTERQTKTETRLDKVLGNVRAFGAGMAAAFTLIGTALGAGITSIVEFFK